MSEVIYTGDMKEYQEYFCADEKDSKNQKKNLN